MSDLREELANHFMSSNLGSRKIGNFPENYRTYTVKDEDYFGVAIYNRENIEIYEKFQSAEIKTVKISEENGEVNSFLLLSSTQTHEKLKFSHICEDFIKLGKDNYYREKILKDPYVWWREWGQLLGDTKSNKQPYAVLAELWTYLKELEKNNSSVEWMGADAKNHDFESESYNLEVKSTLSQFKEEITISSQFQLEHDHDLYINFLILQENIDGYSIEDLIKKLVDKGVDIDFIEKKLFGLNYPKGNNSRKRKYKILEAREYAVNDNFPVINSSTFVDGKIPLGIKKISYTIDLGHLDYNKLDVRLDVVEG